MNKKDKSEALFSSRFELMKVTDDTRTMGVSFHIYVRNRMPSTKNFPDTGDTRWEKVKDELESSFEWLPEHRFELNELNHLGRPFNHHGIHLKGGVTCYRSHSTKKIQVIYDHDSDREVVDEVIDLVRDKEQKPKNRVGLIQMSFGNLNVKFVEYRPYELEITPFLGEGIMALKEKILQSFKEESSSGLYLIHGKPGTGKTSFLKEILNETDKQALFIPPSIAGELGNPNLISLLMDHSDSILIIEDAETVLMKRKADNSNAVSNLLNLTDGFPADFLNLNIICTFNTNIEEIDPALLRKGRLRGIKEFTKLSRGQAQKLADEINSNREVTGPMTVAEVCNSEELQVDVNTNGVGFKS